MPTTSSTCPPATWPSATWPPAWVARVYWTVDLSSLACLCFLLPPLPAATAAGNLTHSTWLRTPSLDIICFNSHASNLRSNLLRWFLRIKDFAKLSFWMIASDLLYKRFEEIGFRSHQLRSAHCCPFPPCSCLKTSHPMLMGCQKFMLAWSVALWEKLIHFVFDSVFGLLSPLLKT